MKINLEINEEDESEFLKLLAYRFKISSSLFLIRYNLKRSFENRIDVNQYADCQELLDDVFLELDELLPNLD